MSKAEVEKFSRYFTICLGIIFLWFGMLKLYPEMSPAECIAESTISMLTFGLVSGRSACLLLAFIEIGLGVALMLRWKLKLISLVVIGHMIGTLSPMVLLPHEFFGTEMLSLTLTGQYIVKNIVLIGVAYFVYVTE